MLGLALAPAISLDVDNLVLRKKSVSHRIKCHTTSAKQEKVRFYFTNHILIFLTFLQKFVLVYN